MTRNQFDIEVVQRVCLGVTEAGEFLRLWSPYVHAIDDIMDEKVSKQFILRTFAMAIPLYSHPFYLRYLPELSMVAKLVTNAYCDVVDWESSDEKWKKEFVDVYRHFGQEMQLSVAAICARIKGISEHDHLRTISQEGRTMSFFQHHSPDGTPH